jgi:putative glycosyl hydrolase-like family 15 (GHL15) protein
MRHFVSGLILSLAALASAGAHAADKPPFPRTAGTLYGNPDNYDDPAYGKQIARLDAAIIKTYPGRASWNPAIQAIKDINPDIKILLYVNGNELGDPSVVGKGHALDTYRAKLDKMKWWLYTSYPGGSRVRSQFGPQYFIINNTPATQPDENGMTAMDWIARYFVDDYYKRNNKIDGFFLDNVFWRPNVDGDWDRDGKIDLKSDPKAAKILRSGYKSWYTTVRQLMPGKLQTGNIGSFGEDNASIGEFEGLINGGLCEGMIGKSWSVEQWKGWAVMMTRYHRVMANVIEPKIVVFNQWGDPKDYQAVRYGLTSTLMDDGYYSFTNTAKGYSGVYWFDEFDAKLGQATSIPPTKAWQNGVFRRDFEGGIALVNPKGNGAKEVTLEGEFVKLKGSQAPAVNNGATVTKVKLADRDGIILLRKAPMRRPKPPTFVSR